MGHIRKWLFYCLLDLSFACFLPGTGTGCSDERRYYVSHFVSAWYHTIDSRPRVSNDNPYAESLFKTLKYRPDYQPKGFATLQEAREWVSLFVQWYNYEHHHSGLKFLTPDQRRSGKSQEILEKRHQVYEAAKEKYPERWNGRATRDWSLPDIVFTGDKH